MEKQIKDKLLALSKIMYVHRTLSRLEISVPSNIKYFLRLFKNFVYIYFYKKSKSHIFVFCCMGTAERDGKVINELEIYLQIDSIG